MADYSNLGLDPFLMATNSPAQNDDSVTAFQFNSNYERNTVTNSFVRNIAADKITAGNVTVALGLGTTGSGYIRLDGSNTNIIVNDGTNDRVLIGYQLNGF